VVSEWIEKYFCASSAPSVDLKLLSHHITVTLSRVEDGSVFVKSFSMVPAFEGVPSLYALTSSGAILSGVSGQCALSAYRRALYKFLFSSILSTPVALELPEGYQVAARDVLNLSSSLVFVGSTYWTNEDAIRNMLSAGVFKANRVAVVRDLFDRHLKSRPHLDSVLFPLNLSTVAVSETILGASNTKRRLVQEYILEDNEYKLTVNDMELGEYLKLLGFTILPVPSSITCASLSLLPLGNGKFIGYSCQKDLVALYKEKAKIDAEVLSTTDCFSGDLLSNAIVVRESHPMSSSSNASLHSIKHVSEVPNVNKPIAAYKDAANRQTSNKLLMVAPIGFLSSAQTALDNYFMNKTTLPEYEVERLALTEYSEFHRALVSEGVCISLYRNERFYETPDAVFPNNWFSTHPPAESSSSSSTSSSPSKSTLFLYPMKAPARRAERREHIVTDLLAKYDIVENMSYYEYRGASGVAFEGTGCLVLDRVNKVAYCALSQRADANVFHDWCKKLNYTPCIFTAEDDRGRAVYHTNVVMGIGSSVAVVCAEAVPDAEQRKNLIKTLSVHHTVVQITQAQMNSFCGNVLEVQGANGARLLVMSSRAHAAFTREQHEIFERHVKKVVHVPVPTIEDIGGGGVRCMMAELF